jgi:phage-related minor tail protein
MIGEGLARLGAARFAQGGVIAEGRERSDETARRMAFGKGGAIGQGRVLLGDAGSFAATRVRPFARGGVVTGPTVFPMRGGTGLMGEAGPEAILPLARGADGRLGVESGSGARPVQVIMNVTTPDVDGFRRSGGQIAAQMSRALARGQRNR